ncbi:Peptidase_M16-domain-containing protein, partial [Fragilariopsis cylindrus CCMP1102]
MSSTTESTESTEIESIEIEIPSVDKRQYKHITLGNGNKVNNGCCLDVLLISDIATDKASAAIDINIGQLCDPILSPGIAHFLEHMLFIGTKKYPQENDYDSYLQKNGGSSNAFTDLEHTNYYFDIQHNCLEGAFDRFAQCFIAPLFTESALEREVQAVDSEHAKNLMTDQWRMFQLSKTKLVNGSGSENGHPFGGFGSGNAESLPTNESNGNGTHIREQLLDFFQTYYRKSLSLYKLVILGRESLDELEEMVQKYFGELVEIFEEKQDKLGSSESSETTTTHVTKEMLRNELYPSPKQWYVPQRLHIIPISQIHSLELQFPIREIISLYQTKPTRYLSHLLGHEGKGSLLSYLKNTKQYVTELYADDGSKSCHDFSIFTIHMELTLLGLTNVNEIITIIFGYIQLLQTKGPQEWIHNESQTISETQFRFLSQRNPMDYTCSLAGRMQNYPSQHYLSGPYKTFDWSSTLVEECLTALNPDNMLILLSSPTFDNGDEDNEEPSVCTEVEPWYGTKYSTIELLSNELNTWKSIQHTSYPELQLPEVNDMIATDLTLLHTTTSESNDDGKSKDDVEATTTELSSSSSSSFPKDQPQCIHQDSNITIWYKPDNIFDMPKVNIMIRFTSGQGSFSPHQSIAAQIFTELVEEQCNEFSYEATMAGLHCDISPSSGSGIELQISGYNHKAHVLVEKLIDTIMDLLNNGNDKEDDNDDHITELFDRVKYKIEQSIQSFLVGQPYQHCIYGGDLILASQGTTTIDDKLIALKSITLKDVITFGNIFMKFCQLDSLVHGNASASAVVEVVTPIIRTPLEKRVIQLNNSNSSSSSSSPLSYLYRFAEFNEANTNSCVAIILQMGILDMKSNAMLAFINHLIREPAFNQLRTEEQLGYIVHTSVKTSGDHIKGLLVLIQSDSFNPNHVEERIELFLMNYRQKLVDMSESDFQTHVDAMVASFLEKNKNLGEESSRYWHVILNKTYEFSRYQNLAEHVKTLKKLDMLRF